MKLVYKKATIKDIEILTKSRVQVLIAANKLPENTNMENVKEKSYEYYREALKDGSHTAYLVFDGEILVGTGGVSYYRVMPTYHNQGGRKAYIMNMYTKPEYRRKGIAKKTLDLLVKEAKSRGIQDILLEATDMGRLLYKKYGFVKMDNEMELINFDD